jgi:hypothetical protein
MPASLDARLSGGQYAQEGELPSPAMDCSLWKVLPSLPVLRRHDPVPGDTAAKFVKPPRDGLL